MSITILSSACSDIGPRKEVNQDNYYMASTAFEGCDTGIFAVADGVSGSAHGEIASRICIDAIDDWWKRTFPLLNCDKKRIVPSIAELIIGINSKVCETKLPDGGRSSSTLTVLHLIEDEWFTFNVGDSRIYRLRKGIVSKLEQLTEDQSCLVEREFNGEKYMKSVLTSCIGGRNQFKYGYSSGPLRSGDRFLVCSDGVYKTESSQQIRKILGAKNATPEQVCNSFIQTSLNNGETDNITAVTVFC